MISNIEENMEKQIYTLKIFLEIEGVFNSVQIKSIHNAFDYVKVRDTIKNWIDPMFSSRIINSSIGDTYIR